MSATAVNQIENNKGGHKINGIGVIILYIKIVSIAFSISAILLISIAIAIPEGITYYEDSVTVKIIEVILSSLSITYLLHDLKIAIINSKCIK